MANTYTLTSAGALFLLQNGLSGTLAVALTKNSTYSPTSSSSAILAQEETAAGYSRGSITLDQASLTYNSTLNLVGYSLEETEILNTSSSLNFDTDRTVLVSGSTAIAYRTNASQVTVPPGSRYKVSALLGLFCQAQTEGSSKFQFTVEGLRYLLDNGLPVSPTQLRVGLTSGDYAPNSTINEILRNEILQSAGYSRQSMALDSASLAYNATAGGAIYDPETVTFTNSSVDQFFQWDRSVILIGGDAAANKAVSSIASNLINIPAHGRSAGDKVMFTGGPVAGLTADQTYYVIATGLTADAFRVSATAGGAALTGIGTSWTGVLTCRNINGTILGYRPRPTIAGSNAAILSAGSTSELTIQLGLALQATDG